MSKEQESVDSIKLFIDHMNDDFDSEDVSAVDNALQRLEAIDNANPSEALECLERIEADLVGLPKHVTEYDDIFDDYLDDIWDRIATIKQALLKTQESKQYLKWDDLQFSYGAKTQKVRMGNTIYKIECVYYDNVKEVKLLSEDEKCYYLGFTGNYKDNVQLFNDLHLEKVED